MLLLPISSKIFERLIFNSHYKFVEKSSLFCSNKSRFKKTDSCVKQLLSIAYIIFESFNNFPSLRTRFKFLEMSKAFDRVWHEGLIYKLKITSVFNSLLTPFQSFLDNRYKKSYLTVKIPIGNWLKQACHKSLV